MDADGSSDAAELRSLLDAAGSSRLVQGSRTLGTIVGGAMPPHQRAGNRVTSALMRRLYSARVTDLGPFRVIEAGLLAELDMTEMTFGWPTEMTVKALRRGVDVVEVPVTWRSRTAGRSKVGGSLAGSVLAGWHIMRVTLRHARRR